MLSGRPPRDDDNFDLDLEEISLARSKVEASLDFIFPSGKTLLQYIYAAMTHKIIRGPNFANLARKVLFIDSVEASQLYNPTDLEYLKKNIPPPQEKQDLPRPPTFMDLCDLYSPYIDSKGRSPIPSSDNEWPQETLDAFQYICLAVMHLYVLCTLL